MLFKRRKTASAGEAIAGRSLSGVVPIGVLLATTLSPRPGSHLPSQRPWLPKDALIDAELNADAQSTWQVLHQPQPPSFYTRAVSNHMTSHMIRISYLFVNQSLLSQYFYISKKKGNIWFSWLVNNMVNMNDSTEHMIFLLFINLLLAFHLFIFICVEIS